MNQLGRQFGPPVDVRGMPLEPALGLPRAVVYERRWVQWLELALGLGVLVFGVVAVVAASQGHPIESKYGPAVYLCLPIGPAIVWEAWRKLRRWTCLVIAENGFDDRMGDQPSGPVLWQEVASMGMGAQMVVGPGHGGKVPTFFVRFKPGPRQPLSPLGAAPKQVSTVWLEIGFRGAETKIPSLMEAAYREWQERQALYGGF